MLADFFEEHWSDADDNPGGGTSQGTGFCISWQNGPLGRGDERRKPNGAFVETLLAVVRKRIEYYQRSRFACEENDKAIMHITSALAYLDDRTAAREKRQVEGTHEE